MKLCDLAGIHCLSGVETGTDSFVLYSVPEESNYIKFTLDKTTYMAIEDPDDGYRSYLVDDLKVCDTPCRFQFPPVVVLCRMIETDSREVLEFINLVNGKTILLIGTEETDDYYPYCVMEYHPEHIHYNEKN